MKAVFLDLATIDTGDLSLDGLRDSVSELQIFADSAPDEVVARIGDAAAVFINKIRLGDDELRACPDLRLICLAATGTDNVDLDAARQRGVAVCNIRDYCTASVAQHVFALLLTIVRSLDGYRMLLSRGAWHQHNNFCLLDLPIRDLSGLVLGIVGRGALGTGVAQIGDAFGMDVRFAARPGADAGPGQVPFDELLATCDVLSLHCPLTSDNHHLLGKAEFARMKNSAIVINTARGGLIDSAALADALRVGEIGGAGIDVLPEEPPVNGDPLLENDVPNLIVTPHVAWASASARQRAIDEMAANVQAFADGGARNRVV